MKSALLGFREWKVYNNLLYPLTARELVKSTKEIETVKIKDSRLHWKPGVNKARCLIKKIDLNMFQKH